MNLPERELYKLTVKQMRPDELRIQIKKKQKYLQSMKKRMEWSLESLREAEIELTIRPKTKRYSPGFYWSNSAYKNGAEWVDGNEELVIVDEKGSPWLWSHFLKDWQCLGIAFNSTRERSWDKISDLK